jgi:hypothetical protein
MAKNLRQFPLVLYRADEVKKDTFQEKEKNFFHSFLYFSQIICTFATVFCSTNNNEKTSIIFSVHLVDVPPVSL